MWSPAPSESPDPPAPFSEARPRNGDGERPSWVAAADALFTYQTRKFSMCTVTVPAVVAVPSVTWYVNVSFWFLSPTPGRKVKLPSVLTVAVPPPVEVAVSATADRAWANAPVSSSVSFCVRTLPVSTTFGPLPVVPSTASVLPITPLYGPSATATGGAFTSVIEIVKDFSKLRFGLPGSFTRTQIEYEFFTSKLKLTALCSCDPETWKLLESGKLPDGDGQPDVSSVN